MRAKQAASRFLSIGGVHTVEKMAGGIIVKTRHGGNPNGLTIYPVAEDIIHEATALRDAHTIMPAHFPKLLDEGSVVMGSIAMTEMFPRDAVMLKEVLAYDAPRRETVALLASLVGRYHRLSDEHTDPAPYRQQEFFAEVLRYRYTMLGLPGLGTIVNDLLKESEHRGVIHGSLSLTNILLRASTKESVRETDIAFVDLEAACVGSRYFDVGFNLGYLILHAMDKGDDTDELYPVYLNAYQREAGIRLDEKLVRRTAIATMLHCLLHPEAAYSFMTIDRRMSENLYAEYIMLSAGSHDGIRT